MLSEHNAGEERTSWGSGRSSQGVEAKLGSETHHLHLRQTLKTGQIHIRPPARRQFHHSWLLIDGGPTVVQRFSRTQLLELGGFFVSWAKHHHHIAHCAMAPENLTWGPALWQYWEQQMLGQPRGQIIMLSDFHGPMPKGSFWLRSCSETPLNLLQILHPLPNWQDVTTFKSVTDRDSQSYLFEPQAFNEHRLAWLNHWKLEQRKTGFQWTQNTTEGLFNLAKDLQKCINDKLK